ncbi:3'-5' exonuclease [Halomicronema sp. CCY15110]|uniref:3'-5' exonuclease n=1 Tax=Halomicronema sp. CCY15110 TaxID=2767773 RepID=UPI00194DC0AF|nr:3'-5' exonuclease [Halomicronema sp. CCY15110]
MTAWAISVANTFLNELLNLPQAIQKKVSKVVKVLEADPISAQGDAKKLKGYTNNVYRVRLGDYRLFYSFGQGWVKLLSIRKRDERTYETEIPEFDAPTPPPNEGVLTPQPLEASSVAPPVDHSIATTVQQENPAETTQITTALPIELTAALLEQWQIPTDYWPDILKVDNSEEILELPIPEHLMSRIVDNLYPRPIEEISAQREYILQQPEDLDRFVEGNLSAFLLKLDPEQENLREFGKQGPVLVKGGPGTGKSTLALYRVETLLSRGYKSILFTTYTKALVAYSEQLLAQLLEQSPEKAGVKVSTVDGLVYRQYVTTYGKPKLAKDRQSEAMLQEALQTATMPGQNLFARRARQQALERLGPTYLLQEFDTVIEGWGIDTLEAYLAHARRGRGIPLQASVREAVWATYQCWRQLMAKAGFITFAQMRSQALDLVLKLEEKPYQAVVIDEAQDLSPVSLRFLLALLPSLDGVYLTADASQSLYQRGFSWKQIHQDLRVTGRTLLLKRNYRNTEQIITACTAILQNTEAGDVECLVQEPSPHQGNIPTVRLTDSLDQTAKLIHDFLIKAARHHRIPLHGGAVLCPSNQMGENMAQALSNLGLETQFFHGNKLDLNANCVKVLTLHSAKGLEFPFVAVVGLQEGRLPKLDPNLPDEEVPVAIDEQRRLFFVGCSRAMRALTVIGSRSNPSTLLNSLTAPSWQR